MDVKTHTFSGAGSAIASGGIFFTLLSTTSNVDVKFYRNNTQIYLASDVEGGFSADFTNFAPQSVNDIFKYAFDRVEIVASGANTVKYGISKDGRGTFNQFSGSVSVTGGTIDTVTTLTGITNKVAINTVDNVADVTPKTMVTGYFATVASTALQTVVTPAANTNGIRIDAVFMSYIASSMRVMTKSSAPASIYDTTAKTLVLHGFGGTSNVNSIALPVIIPAGDGLYHQANAATSHGVGIDYEVL